MTFPTLFTVGVHRCTESIVLDDYGDPEPVFTPAKDTTGEQVAVYGWSTPSSTEPAVAGHDRVVVDVQLLAPPDTLIGAYDLVDLPDGQYQVIGTPEDYGTGPFAFAPGVCVNLRKVSG